MAAIAPPILMIAILGLIFYLAWWEAYKKK